MREAWRSKFWSVGDAAHGAGTQDFLLVTHKVFFAKDPVDFLDFPAAVAGAGSTMGLYSRTIGFFFGLRPFRFKWRGFMALQAVTQPVHRPSRPHLPQPGPLPIWIPAGQVSRAAAAAWQPSGLAAPVVPGRISHDHVTRGIGHSYVQAHVSLEGQRLVEGLAARGPAGAPAPGRGLFRHRSSDPRRGRSRSR